MHPQLPGQGTVESFISEEEEASILEYLDGDEGHSYSWRHGFFNGPAYRKTWGVTTDLKTRKCGEPQRSMPEVLFPIIRRMRRIRNIPCMKTFRPNEANAIDYRRSQGHYLGNHCDDRQLSGPILCNLCLGGSAVMIYTKDVAGNKRAGGLQKQYEVPLPRRALQIQSGTVRYDYQHGIPNQCLLDDRRVSITFRQNIYPGHNC